MGDVQRAAVGEVESHVGEERHGDDILRVGGRVSVEADGIEDKPRHWDLDRALAFQNAVEPRTLARYAKFYQDLCLS